MALMHLGEHKFSCCSRGNCCSLSREAFFQRPLPRMAMSMFLFVPANNVHTSVGGSCWMLGGRQNLCKTQRDRGCMSPARKNATEKIGSAFVRAPKTHPLERCGRQCTGGSLRRRFWKCTRGTILRVNWVIEWPELCRLHKQRPSDLRMQE